MRKLLLELIVLLGIGGLIWAAFAHLIKWPENLSLVSRDTEAEIGVKVREAVIRSNSFDLVYDDYTDDLLLSVADRIATIDSLEGDLHIELIDNEMINAFALPGGYIIVTTGLIEFCETGEEFLSVVCHEVAHVVNRDVLNRLISTMGLELLLSNDPFITGEIAKALVSSGYSRSQEREADRYTCRLMESLQLEPRALATFLRRVKEDAPWNGDYQFEFISSHPDYDSRIREVLLYSPAEGFTPTELWFSWEELKAKVNDITNREEKKEQDELD
jgi:predicted Zn-dependent protease